MRLDITIVNLNAPSLDDGCFHIRAGNACEMVEYEGNASDVVHSNSIIEHVGHWRALALMSLA